MATPNSAADEAPWFDKRWTHRVPIWQNHKMISGEKDLVDFPTYFEWTSTRLAGAQPSGSDFLFTAADGVRKLCHEIREWNSESHRLRGYVKVPRLSPRHDTLIFLYSRHCSPILLWPTFVGKVQTIPQSEISTASAL